MTKRAKRTISPHKAGDGQFRAASNVPWNVQPAYFESMPSTSIMAEAPSCFLHAKWEVEHVQPAAPHDLSFFTRILQSSSTPAPRCPVPPRPSPWLASTAMQVAGHRTGATASLQGPMQPW